MPPHLSQP